MTQETLTLEQQRAEFIKRRFLATPLTGMMVWLLIGLVGLVASKMVAVWSIFIGTGSIAYIGIFVSKLTGEDFLAKDRPKNTFDTLFFYSVGMAVLVYSIAIPFFMIDYTSLPLTVGILTGLMWLPFTWIIKSNIGTFHALARTALVVVLWFVLPDHRFTVIPLAIVLVYFITIVALEKRWRSINNVSSSN